jgi:Icc-related predicted phosphoesterase
MKIQIFSDIHLEFGIREIPAADADIVIFAGDIDLGESGVNWMTRHFNHLPVIWVLGNHEYYHNSLPGLLYKLKELTRDTNVTLLENESIQKEGITFHGATLWSDFELSGNTKLAALECYRRMNDYRLIRKDPDHSRIHPADTLALHKETRIWLEKSLTESKTKKNVVITHHAPSGKSLPEIFGKHLISAGFASNLEDFILDTKPEVWIHGHIHRTVDYTIGQTRVICNPMGYPKEKNTGYTDKLVIEI